MLNKREFKQINAKYCRPEKNEGKTINNEENCVFFLQMKKGLNGNTKNNKKIFAVLCGNYLKPFVFASSSMSHQKSSFKYFICGIYFYIFVLFFFQGAVKTF